MFEYIQPLSEIFNLTEYCIYAIKLNGAVGVVVRIMANDSRGENMMMMMMAKKAPNPVDKHVGSRVRLRRMMLSMSQEKLGDALGLTFQQVQKYEKGANRIGASRLQQISHSLQVPVSFFFEGAPDMTGLSILSADAPSPTFVSDFLATSEGLALTKAFMRIKDARLRRRIVDLVESIAGENSL